MPIVYCETCDSKVQTDIGRNDRYFKAGFVEEDDSGTEYGILCSRDCLDEWAAER